MEYYDIIEKYLSFKYKKNIIILEEVLSKYNYNELIFHITYDGYEEIDLAGKLHKSFYDTTNINDLDIFERRYKIKKIKKKINNPCQKKVF